MTDTFRALCAELMDEAIYLGSLPYEQDPDPDLIARARAALARPEPQGPMDEEPTDQEIEEWADADAEVPLEEMDPEVHGWRQRDDPRRFSPLGPRPARKRAAGVDG